MMLKYVLIVAGFIIIFLTILPPTWYVDAGTFMLGVLLLLLGIIEMNKEKKFKEGSNHQ
jgi:uncharacterized membrane protein